MVSRDGSLIGAIDMLLADCVGDLLFSGNMPPVLSVRTQHTAMPICEEFSSDCGTSAASAPDTPDGQEPDLPRAVLGEHQSKYSQVK